MKKAFSLSVLLAAAICLSSCTLSDLLGINLDYDISNPWSSWDKVSPGVYLGTEDGYNKDEVIAKGTDGSIITCDVDKGSSITPREFGGFDGTDTVYGFGGDKYKGSDYLWKTIDVMSKEPSNQSILTVSTNIDATKKLWGAKGVGLITSPKKYKKLDKGGTFWDNYKFICSKYQDGGYVDPAQQLTTSYTVYDTKWLYDKYPSDMNARGWVVPYTGSGKIEWMTVCRQKGWDDRGKRKTLWGGCSFENITYVKAEISGISYDDAAAYVAKVKAEGKYNKLLHDSADGSSMISFETCSDDSTESTEGFSGYITPQYKISYTTTLFTTLTVEFSVEYVTYV